MERGNVIGKKGTAGRKYKTPLGYREQTGLADIQVYMEKLDKGRQDHALEGLESCLRDLALRIDTGNGNH